MSVKEKCGICKRGLVISSTREMIPHIVCQVCISETGAKLHLCLACFCDSRRQHNWSHPYVIPQDPDKLPSSVLPNEEIVPGASEPPIQWSQREDLALLHGVDRLGYGNWLDISSEVLKQRHSPAECAARFERFRQLIGEPPLMLEDMSEVDRTLRERAFEISNIPGYNLHGFMPLRQDFEEYDDAAQEAEKECIADMMFGKDDEDELENGPEWNELKLKVLRNYNLKLDAREQRKRFVLENGYLDIRRLKAAQTRLKGDPLMYDKGKPELDPVLFATLETLSRFATSAKEHEELVNAIANERRMRDDLRKLQQYRAMGVRTFDEIEWYNRKCSEFVAAYHNGTSNGVHAPKRARLEGDQAIAPSISAPEATEGNTETIPKDEEKVAKLLGISPIGYKRMKEDIVALAYDKAHCHPEGAVLSSCMIDASPEGALVRCELVLKKI